MYLYCAKNSLSVEISNLKMYRSKLDHVTIGYLKLDSMVCVCVSTLPLQTCVHVLLYFNTMCFACIVYTYCV